MPPRGRGSKDKILEAYGLLNYQTEGKSQAEIAAGYARMAENGGPQVDEKWFNEQYGGGASPRQMQGQYQQPQESRQQQGAVPARNIGAGNVQYTNAPNGLLVKVTQGRPQVLSRQQAQADALRGPDPNFIPGARLEDALSGKANWTDVSVAERKKALADPLFYKNNEITKYMPAMQQQILADPAFDWEQVPAWQKKYFELSSSPAGMGAVQGGAIGLIGGPLGSATGAVVGAGLGGLAGAAGYDQTKEWWQQGDNKWTGFDGWTGVKKQAGDAVRAGFGLFNWLAEQAEKGLGLGFQVANAATDPNKNVADLFKDTETTKTTWNAGATFGEVIAPAFKSVMEGDGKFTAEDILKIGSPPLYVLAKIGELIRNPEKYKGEELYLGANSPIQLDQSWIERIDQAREEIKTGRNYREVMTEMQTGVVAQIGDMAVQAIADPLNVMPQMKTKIGGAIAEAGGNKVAAQAFKTSGGLNETAKKYKTMVQTGQAAIIDPNFKVDQMGILSRWIAGTTKEGEVRAGSLLPTRKGLLDPVTKKVNWIQNMAEQTPHSRAQTGAGMFYENIGTMLTMFDDPKDAVKYLSALSKGDNETWAQLGSQFANSPEFYTILPALKDFSSEKLGGIAETWEMTAPNREMLTNLSDILGENPATLLDDLAKRGTSEQDFTRIVERLKKATSPEAKAMLAEVEAGRFTAETLKQTVDIFTGDGALPFHPGQWKAQLLDTLGDHYDQWVTKRLMLDQSPEAVSAFYRTTALLKQAQSIMLLGMSPGYAITNGLSNMVHRAATGIYGYLLPSQINTFLDRMGVTPARMDEGVGIGGQVETKGEGSRVKTTAMDQAVKGQGPLTTAKNILGKFSRGMPFSKLSSWFEKTESRQAYTIAMKQFWSQSWRRGVGFSKMTPELSKIISDRGIAPDRFYAAIEAGMNQGEIEKALFGQFEGVQARSLINDAAQRTGMKASDAATMLDQIGILDTLDAALKGKTTREGVQAAFARANKQAQDWADMQTGEDLKAIAESVSQRVGLEGAVSALDVVQKANGAFIDAWMDHYARFGEVMADLSLLDDPAMRNKAIDFNYQISDEEFRRVYARHAANYKGIFGAWGLSKNPDAMKVLEAIGESDAAMRDAYRNMREIRKGFFDKYRDDFDNPVKWDEWDADTHRIDRLFKDGFEAKHQAEIKQGAALGLIYESLHGPAAGEAARLWWEDVVKFNEEMVKREQDFRGEIARARRSGVPKELIEARKQKYYSTDKLAMIAETERINGEGIARLERVIKGGFDTGKSGPAQSPSGPPSPGGLTPEAQAVPPVPAEIASAAPRNDGRADEVNALLAAAEQRKGAEAKAAADRLASIWDVAENYAFKGLPYDRAILQDKFALLGALRKPEYGGLADLTGLNDPRLTPELMQSVMETRQAAKELQATQQVVQAVTNAQDAASNVKAPRINENTTILRAISEHGGINKLMARDLTGEKRPKTSPGVFTNKGVGIDEMARMLADDGYPIDVNDPNDLGGVQQTTALLNRARAGDKVYPIAHDHDAMLARAQDQAAAKAFGETFDIENVAEIPFDQALWQTEFADTISRADLTKMYELIGDFPEELSNSLTPDGETFAEFMSRVADETAARVEADIREQTVAEHVTRAESAMAEAEVRAEAATTRNLLKEKFEDVFGLSEEQATAYMELSDAVAGWYEKMTGENPDAFYSRYYEDVVKSSDQPSVISDQQDPNTLNQNAKGAVTFDQAGMKATIHAFEAADFTTLIHENGHVFRRVLKDTAERTNNPYIKADLATIEEWAGVKDGVWSREHEEKFARGFERYITEGRAPTPKLARAFEMFKGWMLEIYKTITGSTIDVKMSDDVRRVFDRMMGEPERRSILTGEDRRLTAREQFDRRKATLTNEERTAFDNSVYTDELTGLESSRAYKDSAKPENWIVVRVDMNALKAANNKFTHAGADLILQRAGKVITEGLAQVEHRAFHPTGDEIEIWLHPSADVKAVMDPMVERMKQEQISFSPQFGGETMQGFSFGYGYGPDVVTADRLSLAYKNAQIDEGFSMPDDQKTILPPSVKIVSPTDPNILFQAEQPFGAYDAASQFHPQSEAMDQGWAQYVKPLMDAMQDGAINQLGERPLDGATRDMSPEGQAQLRNYMRKVQNEMSTTKLATIRHGESKRDFALLNYSKRYGFDRTLEFVLPYQFYQTRTMFNWGLRALDKPAIFSNYARLHNQQNRYERDIPERLRNKIKIKAPWLPEWMGDSVYIDPLGQLFPPANLLRPYERMMQETNYQQIEAERVLQEWAADETYSQTEIQQAAQSRSGTIYERAFAEAQIRREAEVNNPIDFFTSMFGPAWYLSTPLSLAGIKAFPNQGDPSKVNTTPMYNTIRGIDTVTQGTWAEPVGNLIGMLGKPEEWARKAFKLPEMGELTDYYVDKQLAMMTTEGLLTSEQATIAMIERQGEFFDQARERAKLELALKVPTMGTLYAGLHGDGLVGGVKDAGKAFLPSLFGAGLLPAGELEYRGLKGEWDEMWDQVDKGNDGAKQRFFDLHPEYDAYLAKNKWEKPEERLKSFLIGQIWDGYMGMGPTNKKQAVAEMGTLFDQAFLDKETRDPFSLDVETLTQWAQMLGKMTPLSPSTATSPQIPSPKGSGYLGGETPKLDLYDPSVTGITDQFFEQRTERFPNFYEQQQGYYAVPKSERTAYLLKNPEYAAYVKFRNGWYDAYPQYKPIFNSDVFEQVDTSGWPPMLEDFVTMYAMTGQRLPSGAYKALEQVWITEGQPMGDFQSWLDSAVAPSFLYSQ